jgi:hypothetical protein
MPPPNGPRDSAGLRPAPGHPTPRLIAERERTRTCRSALRPGWRSSSFWRDNLCRSVGIIADLGVDGVWAAKPGGEFATTVTANSAVVTDVIYPAGQRSRSPCQSG